MTISAYCDDGGHRFRVDEDRSGRCAPCNECGGTVVVPRVRRSARHESSVVGLMAGGLAVGLFTGAILFTGVLIIRPGWNPLGESEAPGAASSEIEQPAAGESFDE